MPEKIKKLPLEVVNKIAAGEVVERPASVVKELVENSLDAQATEIIVEISKSGKKQISVIDNGCGIASSEVPLAFERYATNKIKSINDLETLTTLGFRGEALPSISSIAKLTCLTRAHNQTTGCKIEIVGGNTISCHEEGSAEGTIIKVEDLFFNIPARLKFLKGDSTEINHIVNALTELSLANPHVSFKLISNKKEILNVPSTNKLEERIFDLFGQEIYSGLLSLNLGHKFLTISGYISKPTLLRNNRNLQYFFVNNRSIRHRVISHAVGEGYRTFLSSGKYPVVFIFINIDPSLIDVNVHPTKREIRFTNEAAVHDLLVKAIKDALKNEEIIPEIKKEMFSEEKVELASLTADLSLKERAQEVGEALNQFFQTNQTREQTYDFTIPTKFVYSTKEKKSPYTGKLEITPLGQIRQMYIIGEGIDGLYIIDQHAASERIYYEKYCTYFKKTAIPSQKLLIPINLEVSITEKQTLLQNKDFLFKLGWEIEEFGTKAIIIRALPSLLAIQNDRQFILDIIGELETFSEMKNKKTKDDVLQKAVDNILKIMACHSAIRAGDKLELNEIKNLIVQLQNTKNPYTCPHGRPTIIKLTKDELAKRFMRP